MIPRQPPHPPFQVSLRTLLLLFVVLGSSLGVFGGWGIVVFGLAVGLAIYLHVVELLRSLAYRALVVLCLMAFIGLLMFWHDANDVGPRRRASCLNSLKQIALALNNYHEANDCFPPAYVADKSGKPSYSWRVLILPYLEYDSLYRMCDLTQPWDSPKNKRNSSSFMTWGNSSSWRWPTAAWRFFRSTVSRQRNLDGYLKSAAA